MTHSAYDQLMSPGRIGKLELRNRIIVTAMGVNLAEPDGTCGARIRAFHEEHAKGGAALVITGVTGVAWPVGAVEPGQIALSDDRFIPGFAQVVEAVHAHGAKLAAQLHHGGRVAAGQSMRTGEPVWSPSPPEPSKGDFTQALLPEELAAMAEGATAEFSYKVLTRDDIQTLIGQFGAAADRAKRAGADAVEIHAGHGYILSSFISPNTNKRDDEYGGSLQNRTRLLIEVIGAVRHAVGPDFPIICKLDSREVGIAHGITLEDAIETARMVEAAGADAITVSAYHDVSQGKLHSASNIPHEPGTNLPAAARVKAAVKIPVIASGRVEPEIADAEIAAGKFDFLAMGRKLLADPALPNKLAAGQTDRILPCIYCYTCVSAIYTLGAVRCAVNPRTGWEYLARDSDNDSDVGQARKCFAIVGGGPGGMEAARRLAADGHRVVLLERGARLGGTLQFAALAYEPNERLLRWLRQEIAAADIDVRLNTEATPELIRAINPDAVIVATGALRNMPAIPGGDLPHVFSGDDMRKLMLGESSDSLKSKVGWTTRLATRVGAATGITANLDLVRKATHQWMPLGDRVVIIGGELVGLELAEFLNERGRQVSVVDEAPRFGAGLTLVRRMRLLDELREHGVALFPAATAIGIEANAVRFTNSDGVAQAIPAYHVIVAKGATGNPAVADQLRAAGYAVRAIGDCTGVSYIEGAMRGAAEAVDAILNPQAVV